MTIGRDSIPLPSQVLMNPVGLMPQQTISLTGLRIRGIHGVLSSEHEQPQDFLIDVSMHVCTQEAVTRDDVAATISYADVVDIVAEIIEGEHVNLIETLADRIARRVAHMGARAVTVTVHKPQAPLAREFADVATTVTVPGPLLERKRQRIVIGIGSNLDTPHEHVANAISSLAGIVTVENVSDLYRSAPRLADGQAEQPDYVNAVLTCYTDIPLLELLNILRTIEAQHGRVRTQRWEARTLDLDVIHVEGVVSADPELLLPHPRAAERRFVLEPWLSIDPAAQLGGMPVAELLAQPSIREQRVKPIRVQEQTSHVRAQATDVQEQTS